MYWSFSDSKYKHSLDVFRSLCTRELVISTGVRDHYWAIIKHIVGTISSRLATFTFSLDGAVTVAHHEDNMPIGVILCLRQSGNGILMSRTDMLSKQCAVPPSQTQLLSLLLEASHSSLTVYQVRTMSRHPNRYCIHKSQ